MRLRRTRRPEVEVGPGERLLAWATTDAGSVVAGTRDAFYPGGGVRVPWEQVERATWTRDDSLLTVIEVGTWGQPQRQHVFVVDEPQLLLELLRERVTASVVLQRHVAIRGNRGLRVIARRAPRGQAEVTWLFDYDEGIDPADPVVRRLAGAALAQAQSDVGL